MSAKNHDFYPLPIPHSAYRLYPSIVRNIGSKSELFTTANSRPPHPVLEVIGCRHEEVRPKYAVRRHSNSAIPARYGANLPRHSIKMDTLANFPSYLTCDLNFIYVPTKIVHQNFLCVAPTAHDAESNFIDELNGNETLRLHRKTSDSSTERGRYHYVNDSEYSKQNQGDKYIHDCSDLRNEFVDKQRCESECFLEVDNASRYYSHEFRDRGMQLNGCQIKRRIASIYSDMGDCQYQLPNRNAEFSSTNSSIPIISPGSDCKGMKKSYQHLAEIGSSQYMKKLSLAHVQIYNDHWTDSPKRLDPKKRHNKLDRLHSFFKHIQNSNQNLRNSNERMHSILQNHNSPMGKLMMQNASLRSVLFELQSLQNTDIAVSKERLLSCIKYIDNLLAP